VASKLDQVLAHAVETKASAAIVGMAADRNGIFYSGAAGTLAPGGTTPARVDSVFRIASMTKAVTGAAAMQLVEQGRIGLDQPMGEIAPELNEVQVLEGFDANGKPITRAPKRPVTMRHLLTHTSGLSYDLFNKDVARYMETMGLPSIATCKLASLKAPLLFDPGTEWTYGIGIDWAGRIVELVSGQTLEAYMQENLFRPLGMKDTTFEPSPALDARMVAATTRTPDGGIVEIPFSPLPEGAEFHMGGGGLFSTAPDYLAFTRMMLNGGELDGKRVLKRETVKLMGENAIGEVEVPVMKSDNPALALTAEMFPGQIKRWGLSFLLNTEDVDGARAAWSLAWAGLHNTYYWIDPTSGVAAVLLMQLLPANDPKVIDALVAFEQAVYAEARK
jgi:CubicO group peptidase (beta-lactamase class C family)